MTAGIFPLSASDVRLYIHDYADQNHLIDGEEFSDDAITLAMKMAASDFNSIPPMGNLDPSQFPSVTLLMYGTVAHLLLGKAAQLARNTMSYSDGGLQIPIEERAELYLTVGNQYMAQFKELAVKMKIQMNMEAGWGTVTSDWKMLPVW
ncbi:MAG TPA: hypothetical protein VFM18_00950 [Methanosarcina sp.]|nr:hypothetical protein [Methanosarcina sp.]